MKRRVTSVGSGRSSRFPLWVIVVGVMLVGVGVLYVPADSTLKGTTRLVFFHGAVVWTALINAAAATLLGLVLLIAAVLSRGKRSGGADDVAGDSGPLWRFFSFATLFWALTLALSFPVMEASWGGILWGESRLVMTFQVVFVYLATWGVALLFLVHRPRRWVAAAAVGTGLLISYLTATTPGTFHPDNPIFRSGDPRFIGSFLVILAGLLFVTGGAAFLRGLPSAAQVGPEPSPDSAA